MNQRFKKIIKSNSNGKPTLICFESKNCPACKELKPNLKKLKKKLNLDLLVLNVSNYNDLINDLMIFSLPTTLLYSDGEIRGRFRGFKPEDNLSDWLSSTLEDN